MNVVITVSETEVYQMNARKFADDKRCRALISFLDFEVWTLWSLGHDLDSSSTSVEGTNVFCTEAWSLQLLKQSGKHSTKWYKMLKEKLGTFFFQSLKIWKFETKSSEKIISLRQKQWPFSRSHHVPLESNLLCHAMAVASPHSVARAVPCLSGAMPWSTPVPRAAAGRRPCSSWQIQIQVGNGRWKKGEHWDPFFKGERWRKMCSIRYEFSQPLEETTTT